MRNLLRTASFRLTFFTASIFAVFVITTFGVSYWIAVRYVVDRIDAEIVWQIEMLTEEYQSGSLNPLNPDLVEPGTYLLLEDARGRPMAKNLPADPVAQRWLSELRPEPIPIDNGPQTFRAQAVSLPDGSRVVVAQDLKDLHKIKEFGGEAFVWLMAAILVLSVLCGALVSIITLRRVEKINLIAGEIMNGHLDCRIPLKGTDDEFDRLSIKLNLMFEQIEKLMVGLRQVSTDLAHDLRTPLARLRQRLEGARRGARCIEDYEQAVDQALSQNDEILEIFGALLRIAHVGSGAYRQGFEDISLSDILETLSETYAPIAEERKQCLFSTIEPELVIHADRRLITQMIVNLVENAIRHSPMDARISITASQTKGGVTAVIADTGPGVPKSERGKIFDRFYRLQVSRTTPGSGLGLSLVSAIVDLHAIRINLSDNRPGLRVTLLFPSTPTITP